MGEIEKLKIRLTNQRVAGVAERAGIARATVYRFIKNGRGSVAALDKINKALDEFGVRRIAE